jgi:serine/threonine protein kinase
VADLGISSPIEEEKSTYTNYRGSPYYASPEMYLIQKKSKKNDVWSFGCVVYRLIFQVLPYHFANELDFFYSLRNEILPDFTLEIKKFKEYKEIQDEIINLLKLIFVFDHKKRINFEIIIKKLKKILKIYENLENIKKINSLEKELNIEKENNKNLIKIKNKLNFQNENYQLLLNNLKNNKEINKEIIENINNDNENKEFNLTDEYQKYLITNFDAKLFLNLMKSNYSKEEFNKKIRNNF